jgi:hypothetical protein
VRPRPQPRQRTLTVRVSSPLRARASREMYACSRLACIRAGSPCRQSVGSSAVAHLRSGRRSWPWSPRQCEFGNQVCAARGRDWERRAEAPRRKCLSVGRRILALVTERPDLTLMEAVAELLKRRIQTSKSSVSRFFGRHGITFKKACRPKNDSEHVARATLDSRARHA